MPGGILLTGKKPGGVLFTGTMTGRVFSLGRGTFPGGVMFTSCPMSGGVISTRGFLPRTRRDGENFRHGRMVENESLDFFAIWLLFGAAKQ